jgi:nucleoside-diphosphate-sugar epimerase
MFAVNVAAPIALLDWARKTEVASFVHASSGGLYGSGSRPFVETDPLKIPARLAFYLSTKRSVEELGNAYQQCFAVTALRYFFVYGPRQRQNMLMPRLVASVREGRPITLQGQDGMLLNPVHVSDAAAATIAAVRKKANGTFNVAGPDVVSLRQIAEIIGKHAGFAPVYELAQGRPGDLVADTKQMRDCLGAPTVSMTVGLKSLCNQTGRSADQA